MLIMALGLITVFIEVETHTADESAMLYAPSLPGVNDVYRGKLNLNFEVCFSFMYQISYFHR